VHFWVLLLHLTPYTLFLPAATKHLAIVRMADTLEARIHQNHLLKKTCRPTWKPSAHDGSSRSARSKRKSPRTRSGPPKKPMLSCCNKNRPLGTKMSVMSLPFHHDPGNQCFLPSTMCELSVRGRCAGLALDVFYLGSS